MFIGIIVRNFVDIRDSLQQVQCRQKVGFPQLMRCDSACPRSIHIPENADNHHLAILGMELRWVDQEAETRVGVNKV